MNQRMKPPSDLLDRALRDLTAEQRARVLDLVTLLGIDRDDPLWLVCLAIGQLQVLVEDAPVEWKDLFIGFQEELTAWTDQNIRTLEAIAKQAETAEHLAASANALTQSLTALTRILNEQNSSSSPSHGQSGDLMLALTDLREGLSHRLDQIERNSRPMPLSPPVGTPPTPTTIGNSKRWGWIAALVLGLATLTLWQEQQRTAAHLQRLQRQLEQGQPANVQPQLPQQP